MTAKAVADANERARAIDPGASFIVQAPAGSGKTELLIQRFLALLGTVRRPDEILAITFTRKAAAEMRTRLLQALHAATGPEPESAHARLTWNLARQALERDRQFAWNLAENPSLLTIQTIDSFNASLVRRMPWISRFGAIPEVAEDPAALYREAAERTLARIGEAGRGGTEAAMVLSHLDNRMDLLRDLLVRMLGRRDQWLRHLGKKNHDLWRKGLERALGDFVTGTLQGVAAAIPLGLQGEILSLGRYAAAHLSDSDRPLRTLAELEAFPGSLADDLSGWQALADLLLTSAGDLRKPKGLNKKCGFPAGKGEPATIKARMQELLDRLSAVPDLERRLGEVRQLPKPHYPEEQWRILGALVELLPLAAAELWLVFREKGTTDFAAIALRAGESLGSSEDPSELLLRLDARIAHILVDEFQDTSYLQTGMLEQLIAGWNPGDGRTLFVVGDPMQSIYLFREAEVGLFLRARIRGVGAITLEPLTLCSNFRSQQGIVDWVNTAFPKIFPEVEDEALGGVVYAPAAAVHPSLPGPPCTMHPFAERNDRAEGEAVASLARAALNESPGETVAVLVRGRTHLTDILRVFREQGLRFVAKDIDLLESRPAVLDILALTRALLHPGDRLCWFSVLRAPWCGLLLSDLHALGGDDPGRTVPDLLTDPASLGRLSDEARQRAQRLSSILSRGSARRGAIGLRRLVEGCWLALGGPVCVDAAGAEDAGRVFALMERLDHGGDLESLDALEDGVQKLFATPDAGADGRLQVMTIHKSKGLEFDHVIIPGLGRSPASGDNPLLRWLEHPDCGLLLAPVSPRDGKARDPIYDAIGRLERKKEDLEVTRLLYVAATRAKKRLHLLGHARPNVKGECVPAAGSLLKKLWPVVEEHFASVQGNLEEGEVAHQQRSSQPIRRLPLNWRLPAMNPAPVPVIAGFSKVPDRTAISGGDAVFSGWEVESARHVGTVTHAYLERIARDGLGQWPSARVREEEGSIRRRLTALGVPSYELDNRGQTVVRALQSVLGSERGRWILAEHGEADSEVEISGVVDGEAVHKVIDRTFVDEAGVRWIIDYKTSEPLRGDLDAFFEEEQERYRGQLATYAALFRGLEEGRAMRAALYFPLFDGWCEVQVG